MKKVLMGIVTAILVLSIGTVGASAACRAYDGGCGRRVQRRTICQVTKEYPGASGFAHHGNGRHCVDEDGDGICDTCGFGEIKNCGGFVDADDDGVCDNCGSGRSQNCGGFVDADGDGVCDRYGSGNCGHGSGSGYGSGGCGTGHGGHHGSHSGRGCHW